MSAARFDVAILGGGLAGLSLAARIAALPGGPRTLVLEPRLAYGRDRTWCFWDLHPHPFAGIATAAWPRWTVRDSTGRTAEGADAARPYRCIPADLFYRTARAAIAGSGHVTLRTGCRALSVRDTPEGAWIATEDGTVEAGFVLDSRPRPPRPGTLAQRFLGQEVVAPRPVFDPGAATLMDFDVPQPVPGAVRFLYLLPFSATEALVEDTWIAPPDIPLPDGRAAIGAYLLRRFGLRGHAVRYEERGVIPMDPLLQPEAAEGRVLRVGLAGGAARPSSGYAFLAVQRMADRIVADLAAGRAPRAPVLRGPVGRWMDAVFLGAIRHDPSAAPALFHALFAHCPTPALLRFLHDLGGPADVARVVASLPRTPMLRAAARLALREGRRGAASLLPAEP